MRQANLYLTMSCHFSLFKVLDFFVAMKSLPNIGNVLAIHPNFN